MYNTYLLYIDVSTLLIHYTDFNILYFVKFWQLKCQNSEWYLLHMKVIKIISIQKQRCNDQSEWNKFNCYKYVVKGLECIIIFFINSFHTIPVCDGGYRFRWFRDRRIVIIGNFLMFVAVHTGNKRKLFDK